LKKIGDIAKSLGTTTRTLRFYEEEGLLVSRRTAGGTRLYSETDVQRLRAILQLAEIGVTIDTIKKLVVTRIESQTGAESSKKVTALFNELHQVITNKRVALENLATEIELAKATVNQCYQCVNKPDRIHCPACPVNEKLNQIVLLNLIWDQEF
jgi:DNA-binding transcriptional MerR regulator